MDVERVSKNIIKYGIYACLFLPLFVGKGFFLFPFIFPKVILFQIITEVLFLFWLILIWKNKSIKLSPISISIFALLAILFITSIFGENFQKSLFSTQERMNGIFTLIHFFIFFLLLNVFGSKKEWLKLFKISAVCGFFVCLSALYQKINPSFLGPMPDSKIYGTQGNSIILSTYLIFNLFLALFLYFNEAEKKHRNWWLGIFFTNLLTIFLAASLSAYLALLVGGIALFCFNIKKLHWRTKPSYCLIGFLALFCLFVFSYMGGAIFQKLTGQLAVQSSLLERIGAWEMGIKAFFEKPLTGFGWENFNLIYDKFYNPELFISVLPAFDRAHNVFVDFLSLSGIFGILAYLTIFISVYFSLKKALKNQKINGMEYSIFLAILASYVIINFFNFDTFSSWLMFFLILGYLNHSTNYKSIQIYKCSKIRKSLGCSMIIIIIPAIVFVQNLNFQSALANFYAYQSTKSITPEGVIENLKKSEKYQTLDRTSLRGKVADFLARVSRGNTPKDSLKIYEYLEPLLQENLKNEPLSPSHYLRLGIFYRNWGTIDKAKLESSEKVFKNLLAQNPKKQSSYFLLAQIKTLKGEHQEAISFARAGTELYDKSPQAHFYLSLAYLFGDDIINFKEELQKSEKLKEKIFGKKSAEIPKKRVLTGFSSTAEYYKEIFEIYWPTKDWQKIIIFADEISKIEIDPYLHEYLASVYANLDEKEKARNEANWIIENYPELKLEGLRFLRTLEIQ